jgi:hypothetical protein
MKWIITTIAAVITLAGCGGAAAHQQEGYLGNQAANPVPILRMTGVPVRAGEVNGTIGADSNRGADGTFTGGETVWVFTYPSRAYRDNRLAHPMLPPQDGEAYIRGPGASIIIVDWSGGPGPSPQEIARRIGGQVVKR